MSDRDLRAAVDAAQQVSVSIMGSDGHVRVGFLTEAVASGMDVRVSDFATGDVIDLGDDDHDEMPDDGPDDRPPPDPATGEVRQ